MSSGLSTSKIHKRLTDSFYCGIWTVCKGKKNERTIDLNKIILLDGTRFEPAISQEQFKLVQTIRSGNRNGATIKKKRVNPMPGIVTCGQCGGKMYVSYRKITVK
jgi:hypothetical protein